MTSFSLKIVTPDGMEFEGNAEELIVRTTTGDIGILAGHINCVAPLGMGQATIVIDGKHRYAACIGGMLLVTDGMAHVVASAFEWADEIDVARAEKSKAACEQALAENPTEEQAKVHEAKIRRCNLRLSVAKKA